MTQTLFISESAGSISYQVKTPDNPSVNLLLAHGAGTDMNHRFLEELSTALAEKGVRVVRFNFPYREQGKKMPGNPKEAILAVQKMTGHILSEFPHQPLFLSGRSYGGRMASHLLAENRLPVKGLIYYGFPLHPAGKPSTKRADHLPHIEVPQLFLQGTNDALADIHLLRTLVSALDQSALVEIEEGDHSFKVPKAAGKSASEILEKLVDVSFQWIRSLTK